MKSAKLVEVCQQPLEDLDPDAGPCVNKKGDKVLVRCLKLLKPYTKKGVTEDEDDDDEDEDYDNRTLPSEGRIMEIDTLSQAYQLVLSSGTKGITRRDIEQIMRVGKLESRMICRRLERDEVIKGFMVDQGRQRTTRFISHRCVGVSNQLQMVAKEQQRKILLYSAAPKTPAAKKPAAKTPPASKSTAKAKKKIQKGGRGGKKDVEKAGETSGDGEVGVAGKGSAGGKAGRKKKTAGRKNDANPTQREIAVTQTAPAECETPASGEGATSTRPDSSSGPAVEQAGAEEEESNPIPEGEELNAAGNPTDNNIVVVKAVSKQQQARKKSKRSSARSQETYRLLRRRNLIIESVHTFRIIEGLHQLQKIIDEEEKNDGINTKCCRKTIFRLLDSLSREGLLKVYKTTVIQDGISKKIEMVVHPSIQPNDVIVTQVIEQARFKISSSYSAVRQQHAEEKAREQAKEAEGGSDSTSKDQKKEEKIKIEEFRPTTVRGLGKSFGFQPKMHRLRLVHNFLWYLIYGHPGRHESADLQPGTQPPAGSDPEAKLPKESANEDGQTQPSDKAVSGSSDQPAADSALPRLDATSSSGDNEEGVKDKAAPALFRGDMKESWKKFIPPLRVHNDFGSGWAMVGDMLLCLPLSIFIQVIQINYEVDGLEEYLKDPVKQHHLIRELPARMKRQLLFKRKYIFSFHEKLQKLAYMGLLQFGPVEKFKDKDQVFVYLMRNVSIVDTTSAEPHYWLVTESPDNPFERRRYAFNTAEDVENYWFDLMCVCLNTALGVVRSKKNTTDEGTAPPFVHERYVFVGLAYLLKGSREVAEDGSIPGDGKGAAGLHSEFFGHLKRNWLWTNHLLSVKPPSTGLEAHETKVRLKSLLTRNALRIALIAGGSTAPRYMTAKRPLVTEVVELVIEPASRNQQVVGGKKRKRKRIKKAVVKVPRKKKKEPKKRTPTHDEADHRALKMMTRQRVYWSVQEDSLMMLCSVATHLLNSKLKRAYVPHCVVRDLLQVEFEISQDKTSHSVGRRTRYILKNPQTLLNYRICLAEVYQDKPLLKLLESKKPADPENPDDCGKSFSEYTRLLRQKFSADLLSTLDVVMPDTKRELFSQFKVSAIEGRRLVSVKDSLRCSDDIHAIVLHNLIQSTLAMTNCQMKSSKSFQTFHMYSRYNQELLCQEFIHCRKKGLVSRRRINQPFGPKKNRALPILPMSYQLSQSYYRCFSWRFPHLLCTESFRFLRDLIDNGTRDWLHNFDFVHETEKRSENGEEVMERKAGSEKKQRQGKEAEKLTEVNDGETGAASKEDEQKTSGDGLAAEDPPSGERTDDAPVKEEPPPVSAEPPNVSDMLRFSMDSPGGACVASLSLMSLGLLSVSISIPKQMVVVDSTLVENNAVKSMALEEEGDDDDDDDDGEDCDGRKKMKVKAHQASHTNYLLMRGYCSPGIVKRRNLNPNDNIVVESCIVRLQLRNTPAHHMFCMESSTVLNLVKCGPPPLPSGLSYFIPSSPSPNSAQECDERLVRLRGHTPRDVEACAQLRRSLDEAGEKGVAISDLHQTLSHLKEPQSGRTRSLQQYLEEFQEEGQVIKVGGLGIRWVLTQHADSWLLTVNPKKWSQSRFSSERQKEHDVPSVRKRSRTEVRQEAEEPPAKTMAAGERGGEDVRVSGGLSSDAARGEPKEEQQLDRRAKEDEEGGNPPPPPPEGGEQAAAETEGRRAVRRSRRIRGKSRDGGGGDAASARPPTPAAADPKAEHVSFISRPWRMVDGNLNRQVCKGMLEGILYHIMNRPGLTQQALVEHYKDVLQPMAVLDLVQALMDMGCVTKKTQVKAPKCSLFSRPRARQTREEAKVLSEVFYEPTISCCLLLSQVLPNERHWNYRIP
ncbi:general transcription factor 3C polypeptide 1-like isoform X2 [Pseudoliparis swirei]|nr:general transcription factor 3C polypeptide 1-like isoform X2 [Pseudoliparis swirei]